jgi:uncharacterized protein with von Willebrand factor type A (vWA) domain
MHHCSYLHEFDVLPAEVREALEGESYAAFMGQPGPGTAIPEATAAVPPPLATTTRRLLATAVFSTYTNDNHRLSERLAHEAASWCNTQWTRLENEDPLKDEEGRLETLEHASTLAEAQAAMPPGHRARLLSAARQILTAPAPADCGGQGPISHADRTAGRVEVKARIAAVAEKWRSEVHQERERFQTRELGRTLGAFVREIGAVLPRLARAQSVVSDLFGADDALWDQSRGEWLTTGWDALETVAKQLEDLPELDRLARILGRSLAATELRTTTQVLREVSLRLVGLGKSEVTGVNFGDDLTSLLPSELALLADPTTEDLFYAKLAHKELLQLDYRRERVVPHTTLRSVPVTRKVVVPLGPVIMCVDTSGSMLGEPEQIAKAMALALARRLVADGRNLYVVAFSTDIRTLMLDASAIDLSVLCEFLGSSFHGGTDLRAALTESLRILETQQFRYSDVLVVSDFKIPKIADRFIGLIKKQQERGTLFHSLTVARAPVRDPLHIFDNSWLFNVTEGTRGIRPDTLRFLG